MQRREISEVDQRFDLQPDSTIRETILQFALKAIPSITTELKLQSIKAKKRQGLETSLEFVQPELHAICRAAIYLELPHFILHNEIKLHKLLVREIGFPQLSDSIKDGIFDCLDDLDTQYSGMKQSIEEQLKDHPELDPFGIIAGARRIFRILNTKHIMQIAVVMYPAKMTPRPENLINHFFRAKLPTNPANN